MKLIESKSPLNAVLVFSLCVTGCGESRDSSMRVVDDYRRQADDELERDDRSALWCDQHRLPANVCAQCDDELADRFRDKGDWCEMHGRPDSQCFACHPDFEAIVAARYQAMHGRKPPEPDPDEDDYDYRHREAKQERQRQSWNSSRTRDSRIH